MIDDNGELRVGIRLKHCHPIFLKDIFRKTLVFREKPITIS